MFGKKFVEGLIDRSAENQHDRRVFLKSAGLAGLGVVGAGAVGGAVLGGGSAAGAAVPAVDPSDGPSDAAVLNFALNLEYLEAEFYLRAATGEGLPDNLTSGTGRSGRVTGNAHMVPFETRAARQYANEIAGDELAHVKFLRSALGSAAVSRPLINLGSSFNMAARAAGLIGTGESFDPFANENNFLLAAFIFEDVGVTAYKGAAPLISNPTYLEAAAGILAVEAYHAGIIRTALVERGLGAATNQISDARDSLDGSSDDDQGALGPDDAYNLVPTDENGIAFSRSADRVLNVVYLTPSQSNSGGFYPQGVNGPIRTSGSN